MAYLERQRSVAVYGLGDYTKDGVWLPLPSEFSFCCLKVDYDANQPLLFIEHIMSVQHFAYRWSVGVLVLRAEIRRTRAMEALSKNGQ